MTKSRPGTPNNDIKSSTPPTKHKKKKGKKHEEKKIDPLEVSRHPCARVIIVRPH
jgi:hypothetical protein